MAAKRGPYCQYCGRAAGKLVLLDFIPEHTEPGRVRVWGGSVQKPVVVPPQVRYECANCGRSDTVRVERDWTLDEWDGESRI